MIQSRYLPARRSQHLAHPQSIKYPAHRMAEQAEQAFAKTFLNTLSAQPVTYADDYQQPSSNNLKRVPVLQIPIPPPPKRKQPETSASSSASISLVFKSLKPPASFSISVQPTDTISAIKSQLALQPSAPPAEAQRLLLKGKALADAKLLREYSIQGGDTVNLMIKPGYSWDPSKPSVDPNAMDTSPSPIILSPEPKIPSPGSLDPLSSNPAPRKKHQRIPSVVLSPSPSENSGTPEKDIVISLDSAAIGSPILQSETLSTYHDVVAKPDFWERLYGFLKSEFLTETDAQLAFEDFLCATKGSLTASEIAKIRDQVGVIGMAGR